LRGRLLEGDFCLVLVLCAEIFEIRIFVFCFFGTIFSATNRSDSEFE